MAGAACIIAFAMEGKKAGQEYVDWMVAARRYEHHLSAEHPAVAEAFSRSGPTPLEIDIHQGIEVGVNLVGRVERQFQGLSTELAPGGVWLCSMWEPHGWRVTSRKHQSVVVIFLPEFLGDEMLGDLAWLSLFSVSPDRRPQVFDAVARRRILNIGRELREEAVAQQPGWETAVRHNLLLLLLTLRRGWEAPAVEQQLSRQRTGDLSRIMPALDLLHGEHLSRITVARAAKACALSRSHFNALFRQTMGVSFAKLCLRTRAAFVAHRLLTTDLPVKVIAEEVGFVDASHLHRAFMKRYGMSPANYRKRFKDIAA